MESPDPACCADIINRIKAACRTPRGSVDGWEILNEAVNWVTGGESPEKIPTAALWAECLWGVPWLVLLAATLRRADALSHLSETAPPDYCKSCYRTITTVKLMADDLDEIIERYPKLARAVDPKYVNMHFLSYAADDLHVMEKLTGIWGIDEVARCIQTYTIITSNPGVFTWMRDVLHLSEARLLLNISQAPWGADLDSIVPLINWSAVADPVDTAMHLAPETLLGLAKLPGINWSAFAQEALDCCLPDIMVEGSSIALWVCFYACQLGKSVDDIVALYMQNPDWHVWYSDEADVRREIISIVAAIQAKNFGAFHS